MINHALRPVYISNTCAYNISVSYPQLNDPKGNAKGELEACAMRRFRDAPLVRPSGREVRKGRGFAPRLGGTEAHNRSSDSFERKRGTVISRVLLWGLWGRCGPHLSGRKEVRERGRGSRGGSHVLFGRGKDRPRAIRFRGVGGTIKHILSLGLGVVLSEAMSHGGIDPMHEGQAAAELFPRFALVHTTLGVSELISASI